MSGETAAERWSPAQRVESVLLSIISLLDDAECSSPANVDAGVTLRKEPEKYRELVKKDVELSKEDIPEDFVMPTNKPATRQVEKNDDRDFWYDSDEDEEFGGSDTDGEMAHDEDDESPDQESGNEEEEEDDEMIDAEDEDTAGHEEMSQQ